MNKRRLSDDAGESSIKVRKVDHDGKLNFFGAPASLKDMAAIKITIALWYHQNLNSNREIFHGYLSYYPLLKESYIHMSGNTYAYCRDAFRPAVSNAIKKLPIPPKLVPCVESNVELIERQLKNWLYYHDKRIFLPVDFIHLANDLIDEIIWRSDGYIDYMATAENLLKSPLLSDVHKFRVMCTYCMEGEIVQFPDYIISPKYLNRVTFNDHPLIFYWNCYLRRKLDKIDFGEATSIENYMITKVDNWAAFEYFFDQLNDDDKVVKAIDLIRSHGLKYLSRVLSKLNESQQHRVFMDCGTRILMNYLDHPYNQPFIFDLWDRCKNLITEKEFSDILKEMVRNVTLKHYKDSQYTVSLLNEMWTTVPAEFKKNIGSLDFESIFNKLFKDSSYMTLELLELFLLMLPDASSEYKAGVLCYIGSPFFYNVLMNFGAHYVHKLLRIICSNAEHFASMKKLFMFSERIEDYCSRLIREKKLAALNDILTTLLSDAEKIDYKIKILEPESVFNSFTEALCNYECENLKEIVDDEVIHLPPATITDYKLKLVESKKVTEFCISELLSDKCKMLRELINNVFVSDHDTANSFVLRICLMDSTMEKFREKMNAGEFNRVKDSAEQFITQEEDLKTVKNELLQSYVKIIRNVKHFSILRKVEWEKFLTWCSSDLKQFRKLFDVEELFNKMLTKSIFHKFDVKVRDCRFKEQCCFNSLNAFLDFYFDTPEEVKEYKIDKVFNFKRMDLIDVLLRKTEKRYLRSVLTWFFDKDYDEIKKFRTTHAKHKISQFI